MSPDKLVYMANQIGKFFASQPGDEAVSGIATHLRKFWDPRMRLAIYAHLDHGGDGLAAPVLEAVKRLKQAEAQEFATNGSLCLTGKSASEAPAG